MRLIKNRPSPISVLFLLLIFLQRCNAIFDWIWRSESKTVESGEMGKGVHPGKAQFEIMEDDKFVEEMRKLSKINFTPLDICQQKIFIDLRDKKCASLNEIDLGKASVQLLNCQSAAEGRQVYPCTDAMTLKECTSPMEPTVWNAYIIFSTKVTAVCIVARQHYFNAVTERSVNKLLETNLKQIQMLESLFEKHHNLENIAKESLQTIEKGNKEIEKQHEKFGKYSEEIQNFITGNIRSLIEEKEMISEGQRKLLYMFGAIKQQIAIAKLQQKNSSIDLKEDYNKLRSTIMVIDGQMVELFNKLLTSVEHVSSRHSLLLHQYKQLHRNMVETNETINYILHILKDTAGSNVEHFKLYATQSAFVIIGMLLLIFLKATDVMRMYFVVVIFLNVCIAYFRGVENIFGIIDLSAVSFLPALISWFYRVSVHWRDEPVVAQILGATIAFKIPSFFANFFTGSEQNTTTSVQDRTSYNYENSHGLKNVTPNISHRSEIRGTGYGNGSSNGNGSNYGNVGSRFSSYSNLGYSSRIGNYGRTQQENNDDLLTTASVRPRSQR